MIDLDELEALHREGLRYPEGVEYDVARTAAFDALPALLRLARRARRLEEAVREYLSVVERRSMLEVPGAFCELRDVLAEREG